MNTPSKGIKWLTPEIRQEMRELFLNGTTKTDISKKYGCGLTTVHRATADLKSKQQHTRKHFVNQQFFANVGRDQAYILGLLWSDGNLYLPTHTVSLSSHIDDEETTKWVAEKLGAPNAIVRHSDNCIQFRFTGKEICDDLVRFGFSERKSTTGEKKFTLELLGEFLWDFVRGLIDGDGCVHFNEATKKKSVFITGNKSTIEQMHKVFSTHDIKSYVKEHPGCWRITVTELASLKKLFSLVYKNIFTGTQKDGYYERKYGKFLGINGHNPRIGRPKKN